MTATKIDYNLPQTKPKRIKHDYIDNRLFSEQMKAHRALVDAAKERGENPRVPVSNEIGKAIYDIAYNFSLRPQFIGYSFRSEMIGDAIETCLNNAHHFNPNAQTRSGTPNAFAYFTKIVYHAFIARIQRERKEEYIKLCVTENQVLTGEISTGTDNADSYDGSSSVDLGSDYYNKLRASFYKEKPVRGKKIVEELDEELEVSPPSKKDIGLFAMANTVVSTDG